MKNITKAYVPVNLQNQTFFIIKILYFENWQTLGIDECKVVSSWFCHCTCQVLSTWDMSVNIHLSRKMCPRLEKHYQLLETKMNQIAIRKNNQKHISKWSQGLRSNYPWFESLIANSEEVCDIANTMAKYNPWYW